MKSVAVVAWSSLLCVLVGCGGSSFDLPPDDQIDSAATDGIASDGSTDATIDDSTMDTGNDDTGTDDTGTGDTGGGETSDSGTDVADSTIPETAVDSTTSDLGVDTTSIDTAIADTAVLDTAITDTAITDTAITDTATDAGCAPGSSRACYGGGATELTVPNTACRAGLQYCIGGSYGPCIGEVRPSPESCNNVDDDCNGVVDDGLGTVSCGIGRCGKSVAACTAGAPTACAPGAPIAEVCGNSIDDDCDGVVDDGCGCVTVAPFGADYSACGGAATPCRTIQYAINKAGTASATGTWPKQVCVAAASGCGGAGVTTTYSESPKMKDGVSVLGGYNPLATGFVRNGNCVTRIQSVDASGVSFDATVTSPTTLDGFIVAAKPDPTNAAITITGSTGAVVDGCIVDGGQGGTTSVGVLIVDSAGTAATPRIQNSTITGGLGSSSAIGIRSVKSAPIISRNCDTLDAQGRCSNYGCFGTSRYVRGRSSGTGSPGAQTYAVRLEDSPNTIVDTSAICSANGQGDVAGIRISGDAKGMLIRANNIVAPGGTTGNVNSVGIWADPCLGASPWILSNYNISGQSRTVSGRADGVRAIGDCHPRIDSNRSIVGGDESANNDAIGVYCARDAVSGISSKCTVLGNETIYGSGSGFPPNSTGIRCDAGACARIEKNLLISGNNGINTFGIVLNGASTFVDRNIVSAGCARGEGIGILSTDSSARVQNNLIVGGTACTGGAPTSTWGVRATLGAGAGELDLHSNTILAGGVAGSCTSRGLGFEAGPVSSSTGKGVIRNNIVVGGACGTAYAVIETSTSADPRIFENNDLWIGVLYRDEGTTNLGTIGAVNGLTDMLVSKNISADPVFFSATNFHIQGTSSCRNAGTAAGAPSADYDGDLRPLESVHDIGYDEYKP